jgi:hypothetical protein
VLSEYIPVLDLGFAYFRPLNNDVLANNIASMGLTMLWGPWDWGCRREHIRAAGAVCMA